MSAGKRIFSLLATLAGLSGNAKRDAFIEASKGEDRALLGKVMYFTYSPRVNFGISEQPLPGYHDGTIDLGDREVWDLLNSLNNREVTGNAARAEANTVMTLLDFESADVFRRILRGDMQSGFSEGTISKGFPKLIEETPYMRCSLPKGSNIKKWIWANGIYVQLKADGTYQQAIRNGETLLIRSRSGEPMPETAFPELRKVLMGIIPQQARFEGEMVVIDPNGKVLPRADGNGMINSVRQGGELDAGHKIKYMVWDLVDMMIDQAGLVDKTPYKKRLQALEIACAGPDGMVEVIPTTMVYSKEEAWAVNSSYLAQGLEGSVLKEPDAIYEDGTSKDQVKVKIEAVADMKIVGYKPGRAGTKFAKKGWIGAVLFESSCGKLKGSTSGMDEKSRQMISENQEAWLGKVCAIKFNDLTQNRSSADKGEWAMSHPRWDEIRTDKVEADSLEKVQAILEATKASGL